MNIYIAVNRFYESIPLNNCVRPSYRRHWVRIALCPSILYGLAETRRPIDRLIYNNISMSVWQTACSTIREYATFSFLGRNGACLIKCSVTLSCMNRPLTSFKIRQKIIDERRVMFVMKLHPSSPSLLLAEWFTLAPCSCTSCALWCTTVFMARRRGIYKMSFSLLLK